MSSPPPANGTIREDQVQNAVRFLSHPSVQAASEEQKREFLKKKGLPDSEIAEAFQRVKQQQQTQVSPSPSPPSPTPAVASALVPSSMPPPPYPAAYPLGSYPYPYGRIKSRRKGWVQRLQEWTVPMIISFGAYAILHYVWDMYTKWRIEEAAAAPREAAESGGALPLEGDDEDDSGRRGGRGLGMRRAGDEHMDGRPIPAAAATNGEADELSPGMPPMSLSMSFALSNEIREMKNEVKRREDALLDMVQRQGHELREMAGVIKSLLQQQQQQHQRPSQASGAAEVDGVMPSMTDAIQQPPTSRPTSPSPAASDAREMAAVDGEVSACVRALVDDCEGREEAKKTLATLQLILKNLLTYPDADRYRKINASSARFNERLGTKRSTPALLKCIGFEQKQQSYAFVGLDMSRVQAARTLLEQTLDSLSADLPSAPSSVASPPQPMAAAANSPHVTNGVPSSTYGPREDGRDGVKAPLALNGLHPINTATPAAAGGFAKPWFSRIGNPATAAPAVPPHDGSGGGGADRQPPEAAVSEREGDGAGSPNGAVSVSVEGSPERKSTERDEEEANS
ncbi:unnamed protein product [Vitrella brassicaformis CCMP3155]|uniref:Peroxisomal membrane protein PEX14 n=3 Tax=Vitrella brassicaformis TaxID=1169539 RepID=A0A0G4GBX1_VITBC|nr:Peroxisomal membrane protein 14 [Vitrella brassicaformis]CEM26609.1 unnamed protein product [Vitrella brassicaformis CCMP3155]|mmetsp:Transcript_20939/g.59739  ORF Transcript_20939/g.59739 Transcript_20939/m.59739 type:complete len:569 (-) Transcript_20939:261-1967(-)|eukprot:CEM26609.1 unnamed protein product [Vitrella brassicaformis CCMP3155]